MLQSTGWGRLLITDSSLRRAGWARALRIGGGGSDAAHPASNDSPSRLTVRLSFLAVGTFVLGVDGFVLPGLLPSVAHDLGVGVATAGQLTMAFAVTYAIGSPIIATATAALDRRWVLGGGMALFLLGMIAQATGPAFAAVLAGRILAGIGARAFQANAYAVAGVLSPPDRRARSLAVIGAGTSVAAVAGVPFGVFVGQAIGWRAALWLIAGLTLVAGAVTATLPAVRLPSATLGQRLRLFASPGMLTLLLLSVLVLIPAFAIVSYIAPLVGEHGQGSPVVLLTLFASGVAFLCGNRAVGALAEPALAAAVAMVALAALVATAPRLQAWEPLR